MTSQGKQEQRLEEIPRLRASRPYRTGEPCRHPGCLSHISHPCEGCGRIGGRYPEDMEGKQELGAGGTDGAEQNRGLDSTMGNNRSNEQRNQSGTPSTDRAVCELCGEPMPEGEEMFNYHGYSRPCPKPPLKPAAPEAPVGEAPEIQAEQKRWQDAIYERLKKSVGAENDSIIDGGGCDSGDPLDFTLAEIGQALAYWQDRALSEEGAASSSRSTPQDFEEFIKQWPEIARMWEGWKLAHHKGVTP